MCVAAALPRGAAADDRPVPRGTRAADAPDLLVSGVGFAAAVEFYSRELARRGIAHERIGPYRIRGVDVARFVASGAAAPWLAVHVFRRDGKTWIFFVKRPGPTTSSARVSPLDVRTRTL